MCTGKMEIRDAALKIEFSIGQTSSFCLFVADAVQCIQSAGLQEREDICQLSPVLLGS